MLLRYFCSCRNANFSGFLENPPGPILKKALRSCTRERRGSGGSSVVGTSSSSAVGWATGGERGSSRGESVSLGECVSPSPPVASCS